MQAKQKTRRTFGSRDRRSLRWARYRLEAAGPFFFIFGLCDPRGSVRLALGGRFARASRFSFFRSALSATFRVFMTFLC